MKMGSAVLCLAVLGSPLRGQEFEGSGPYLVFGEPPPGSVPFDT